MSKTIQELPQKCQPLFKIYLNNILENYQVIRHLSGGCASAAVIKANAYGHGITETSKALYHDAGCGDFFVATLQEALTLRQAVKDATIYVLCGLIAGHEEFYKSHRLIPTLCDLNQIKLWQKMRGLPCAIHFDTGINRLGLNAAETDEFIGSSDIKSLNIHHIMSHLACADETSHPLNHAQLSKFKAITDYFKGTEASLANSSGILMGKDYHFDLLRPGIMLFGGHSSATEARLAALKHTCEIIGKVIQIKPLEKDTSIGYNSRWKAQIKSQVAYINVGYADGLPLSMTGKGFCFIGGEKRPIIGQISMDMLSIDITGLDNIKVGDEAELLGSNIPIEFVAEVSSLSQYEILTNARERYQRLYLK
jgi:alanine racemase